MAENTYQETLLKLAEERKRRIILMRQSGMRVTEIARVEGVTRQRIWQIISLAAIKPAGRQAAQEAQND